LNSYGRRAKSPPFFSGENMPCIPDIYDYVWTLRVLINDMDPADEKYSDEDLIKILGVAAKQAISMCGSLSSTYEVTVDFSLPNFDICPEPPSQIQSLVVLKAACLMDTIDMKDSAISSGIKAVCGPISMQTSGSSASAFNNIIDKGFCGAYKDLCDKISFRDPLVNADNIAAILGPFRSNTYDCCKDCGHNTNGGCGC